MRVLEIGVGTRRQADTTVSIDKSAHANPDIVRDVAKRGIPFTDNKFDKVYSFEVIEHIEHYEDLVFLLNEIWRVLKPEGIWHFSTPMGLNGFDHMTHHRVFSQEAFSYLSANLPEDYEHMRIADGIMGRFELVFENTSNSLVGKFKAIK